MDESDAIGLAEIELAEDEVTAYFQHDEFAAECQGWRDMENEEPGESSWLGG